jgi:hypothetical protein
MSDSSRRTTSGNDERRRIVPNDTEYRKTDRGFDVLTWRDFNNTPCELQQSSLAHYQQPGASCVWLGTSKERMHLTVGRARWLARQLAHWAEHGTFSATDLERGQDWPDADSQ